MDKYLMLRVCYDCYFVNENGFDGLDLSEERSEEIDKGLGVYAGTHRLHTRYTESSFSKTQCDICRSHLGGDRFKILAEEL